MNKTSISSICVYITDGLRRPVYLNNTDSVFSLILKKFLIKYCMKSREFYHPRLGRYIYEHRGNGLIVDNIMKPLQSTVEVIRPLARKELKAGKDIMKRNLKNVTVPHMRLGWPSQKGSKERALLRGLRDNGINPAVASERQGDIIMKRLRGKAPKGKNKRSLTALRVI